MNHETKSSPITVGETSSVRCDTCECGISDGRRFQELTVSQCSSHNECSKFGRVFNITRPITDYKIFYIGHEGPTLTNFMLSYKENEVI